MAISDLFLSMMRNDASTNRMRNHVNILDPATIDDGHGTKSKSFSARAGGPFKANIQIKQRLPYVDGIEQRVETSTQYIIRVDARISINKQSKIQDITSGQIYEIIEELTEPYEKLTTLLDCKKVT